VTSNCNGAWSLAGGSLAAHTAGNLSSSRTTPKLYIV
jgi:hypothetical protein